MDIERELSMARNMSGPLSDELKERIRHLAARPTQQTWTGAYSIIVGADQWMTLWQAVRRVDPTFPASKPSDGPWPRVPGRATVREALRLATH